MAWSMTTKLIRPTMPKAIEALEKSLKDAEAAPSEVAGLHPEFVRGFNTANVVTLRSILHFLTIGEPR